MEVLKREKAHLEPPLRGGSVIHNRRHLLLFPTLRRQGQCPVQLVEKSVSEPLPTWHNCPLGSSHSRRRPEKCGGCRDSARARPIGGVTEPTRGPKKKKKTSLHKNGHALHRGDDLSRSFSLRPGNAFLPQMCLQCSCFNVGLGFFFFGGSHLNEVCRETHSRSTRSRLGATSEDMIEDD